jgi:hypothetical protein
MCKRVSSAVNLDDVIGMCWSCMPLVHEFTGANVRHLLHVVFLVFATIETAITDWTPQRHCKRKTDHSHAIPVVVAHQPT